MAEVPVPEVQMNGGGTVALNPSEPVGSKRQRRPSVRLGDIGDQTMESHPRRATTKPWRFSFYNASVDNSESPIHSMGNLGDDDREGLQHYHHQGNVRDRNNGRERCGEDGVRIWLNGLGLGRYAPVFQIHEVDDEVLPLLTLEDLKDMGINAVGSRRKMYCAIQKLGKGFS
ncbi:Sterile alpha motif domain [Sesbania bispinosa]|nr:Sterile alpha motif domain [Sesbania bispinosa]